MKNSGYHFGSAWWDYLLVALFFLYIMKAGGVELGILLIFPFLGLVVSIYYTIKYLLKGNNPTKQSKPKSPGLLDGKIKAWQLLIIDIIALVLIISSLPIYSVFANTVVMVSLVLLIVMSMILIIEG